MVAEIWASVISSFVDQLVALIALQKVIWELGLSKGDLRVEVSLPVR